jgi:recombination protein RecT
MEASALGLEIGLLGECYLIPYKSECTMQIGYQGLIKLAVQSKSVLSINSGAVREGDYFEWELGSHPYVKHRPNLDNDPEAKPRAFYCVVRLPNGGFQATVMSAKEVDRIRARSRSGGDGPWVTDYEQMGVKTVIKRALKNTPKSPELARAVEADNASEIGGDRAGLFPEIPDALPGETPQEEQKQDTASQVADALGVKKKEEPKDEWGLDKDEPNAD